MVYSSVVFCCCKPSKLIPKKNERKRMVDKCDRLIIFRRKRHFRLVTQLSFTPPNPLTMRTMVPVA